MSTQTQTEIQPGTLMVHRSGGVVQISHRKDDDTGWWNTDRSGLADFAIASDDWTPYTPRELRAELDLAAYVRANHPEVVARLSGEGDGT